VFVVGWVLMVVAMMLPTSTPLILTFAALVQQRSDRRRLVVLVLIGYLSVWTVFGLAVQVGDAFVHAIVARSAWLEANGWLIGASTLVLAGVYQFVPLKYLCLDKCRSPLLFIMGYWLGRHDRGQAFRIGVHHGLFCLGCCWSLMLLMFAVGAGSFGWMLALGAVMAAEKNLAWGRRLSAPLGGLLIGSGLAAAIAGGIQ
jgi:predicted metal-binding membrane protein